MSELRPKMPIARLTEERMRKIVSDRLARQVMFSDEVTSQSVNLVFLPAAMGAFAPPEELRLVLMGSLEPPETLEGEPPKPEQPSYPPSVGDPPPKPTLIRLNPEVERQFGWGDLDQDDLDAAKAKVEETNRQRIQEWDEASFAWDKSIDDRSTEVTRIDTEHEQALAEWEASLDAHEGVAAERQRLYDEWVEKHDLIFSEWGSDIGVLMGDMKDAFPRGINGYPMFHACLAIHKEDWERIRTAIIKEQDREINV
jgi:hypothetical protein